MTDRGSWGSHTMEGAKEPLKVGRDSKVRYMSKQRYMAEAMRECTKLTQWAWSKRCEICSKQSQTGMPRHTRGPLYMASLKTQTTDICGSCGSSRRAFENSYGSARVRASTINCCTWSTQPPVKHLSKSCSAASVSSKSCTGCRRRYVQEIGCLSKELRSTTKRPRRPSIKRGCPCGASKTYANWRKGAAD